jgi:hypothetical protein
MRRQERETTECNECNGDQLYMGGRQQGDDSFPEKKVGSSKDFEIRGILEKEPRHAGRTSYQPDRNGYLPEVKIESSE